MEKKPEKPEKGYKLRKDEYFYFSENCLKQQEKVRDPEIP